MTYFIVSYIVQQRNGRLFLEDVGETPDKLFAEFNYTPIAAASIAQVFVAKTKDNQDRSWTSLTR